MKAKQVRQLSADLIHELGLDKSATIEAACVRLCEVMATRLREPVTLRFDDLGTNGPSGVWAVTRDRANIIIVTTARSWMQRLLILLHEVAHMLCGHDPARIGPHDRQYQLFPDLAPGTPDVVAGRPGLRGAEEREADQVAGALTLGLLRSASQHIDHGSTDTHRSRRPRRSDNAVPRQRELPRNRGHLLSRANVVYIGTCSAISCISAVTPWFGAAADSSVGARFWPVLCAVSAAIGLISSTSGQWFQTQRIRSRQYCADLAAYLQLLPLWLTLRAVAPEMVHGPGTWRDRLSLRWRLFWRLVEINDWMQRVQAERGPAGIPLSDENDHHPVAAPQMRHVFAAERERAVKVARSFVRHRLRGQVAVITELSPAGEIEVDCRVPADA